MPGISAAATLDLWEAAGRLGPVERSLALASALEPATAEEVARLPLGRRDARILGLHTAVAGRALDATAACPACGEQVEFAVDAADLVSREVAGAPAPLEIDGRVVHWRLVDSDDVAAASQAPDVEAAERVLLERCAGPDLPDNARAALASAMADADPLAEVLVDVVCPACDAQFVADLDVASFVWAEVRARAQRLLRDVDVLARAYGWTEAEVLALSERRREAYLSLADVGIA